MISAMGAADDAELVIGNWGSLDEDMVVVLGDLQVGGWCKRLLLPLQIFASTGLNFPTNTTQHMYPDS